MLKGICIEACTAEIADYEIIDIMLEGCKKTVKAIINKIDVIVFVKADKQNEQPVIIFDDGSEVRGKIYIFKDKAPDWHIKGLPRSLSMEESAEILNNCVLAQIKSTGGKTIILTNIRKESEDYDTGTN